jgi:protoporphyrinogen/coproporphyrinogen III oxidase
MATSPRVVVIGGGISGLAAAYELRKRSPAASITVVEREPRLGGKILTDHVDGFVIECGPDSFLASKPAALELCREIRIQDRLRGTRQDRRGAFVLRAGRLLPIPEGLSGLVPARLDSLLASDLLSQKAKARVAREPEVEARIGPGDESLGSFVERRFGREIYERLIEPLMSGIYAGDGDRLSLLATFPNLRDLEIEDGSVLEGLRRRAQRVSEEQIPASGFLAPKGGMHEIVDALSHAIPDLRVARTEATGLSRIKEGFRIALSHGAPLDADAVVVATQGHVAASLLESLDASLSHLVDGIPHVSTTTVTLAFDVGDVPHGLMGHGYVVPRAEGRPVLACTWVSSKWEHRTPDGFVLLRLFLGRDLMEAPAEAPDNEVVALARDELREILGVSAEPRLVRIYRWPKSMPQYRVGHLDRLSRIHEAVRGLSGVALAGNYMSGMGIPDCIRSGEAAAARIAEMKEPVQSGRVTSRVESGGPDRI